MARTSYHVIPSPNGGWSVKKASVSRVHTLVDRFRTIDCAPPLIHLLRVLHHSTSASKYRNTPAPIKTQNTFGR